MAKGTGKWIVIGCGLGCLLVIVVLGALGTGGFFFVKNIVGEFQQTGASHDAVIERFGRVSDFVPDADGAIRPERMEAFIAARGIAAPVRDEVDRSLTLLSGREDPKPKRSASELWEMMGAGAGIVSHLARFLTARNEAMLDAEIGMGEYHYIYVLSYYAHLRKSPADGPPFTISGSSDHGDAGGWQEDEFEVREQRMEDSVARVRRNLLPMLRRQLEAAGSGAGPTGWRDALEAEIAAMEADRYRMPWADGLPEPLEASLAPYGERLDASYSKMCNPLELND